MKGTQLREYRASQLPIISFTFSTQCLEDKHLVSCAYQHTLPISCSFAYKNKISELFLQAFAIYQYDLSFKRVYKASSDLKDFPPRSIFLDMLVFIRTHFSHYNRKLILTKLTT